MPATRLNPKETAKILRSVMKKAFPNTKFSITTGRGAGVSSARVSWVDGPTTKEVDAIVGAFEMGHFDGMTDSYNYDKTEDRQLLVNGEHYEAGCRYVMTERRCSAEFARKAVALLVEYWGGVVYIPEIIEQTHGGWWFVNSSDANRAVREDLEWCGRHYDWQSQIQQALSDPSRFVREVVAAPAVDDGQGDDSNDPTSVFYDYRKYPPFAPALAKRTWTEHTAKCTSCGDLFRVSQEAIDEQRKDFDTGNSSDAEIANHTEFCLECCDGIKLEGEKAGLNA